MKKLFLFLLSLVAVSSLSAEPLNEKGDFRRFRLGFYIDPTITMISSKHSNLDRLKTRMGHDLGIRLDFFFAENYALSTGLSYVRQTSIFRPDTSGFTFYNKDKELETIKVGRVQPVYQSVHIPISLHLQTHEFGRFRFVGNLGVDLNANVKSSFYLDDNKKEEYNFTVKDASVFSAGWHILLMTEVSLGQSLSVTGGISYTHGFTDLHMSKDYDLRYRQIGIRLGVMF